MNGTYFMQQESEEWKKLSKKTKQSEKTVLVIIGLILLAGYILQCTDICMCQRRCLCIEVIDKDTSLAILQIHGTIATLSITVITLINGSINNSLYGVSVTDFFMNRKPCILTHKRIMVITFLSIIINVIVHLYGIRWMVFAIFIAVTVLIIYSSLMMCAAFKGIEEIDRQIKQYVISFFEEDNDIESKKQMLHAFMNDWILRKDQNIVEREHYQEIYDYAIEKLLYDAEVRR